MPHDVSLITLFAVAFVLASVFGYIATRMRLPPLVGYLVAGALMATAVPGYEADTSMAGQLAEIGVILLMFGVGLHFSLGALLAVRSIAIPGAVAQIGIATALGAGMMMLWGWSLGAGLVVGLCLSVASTVVLVKALEERSAVHSTNGRIAVGWLIVEDLAMVVVLVLLPALAEVLGGTAPGGGQGAAEHGLIAALAITLVKVAAFAALALLLGPRVMPWILRQVARTGSRELFTLAVLTLSVGIAFGATKLFDVSFALGAFFAGMVLNESELSHKAAAQSLPLQDAFAVLFFVSVGMLFDPAIIVREPLMVAGVLFLILIGKSLIAFALVMLIGYPASTAFTISAALAQVGEFSFILAGLGLAYGLLPREGLSLIVAGSLISIALNPMAFSAAAWATEWVRRHASLRHRWETGRHEQLGRLEHELERARLQAEEKAAKHRTLSPQELAERFPMFAMLTHEQREVVMLYFKPHAAHPGERIIHKGDKADAAYFLSSGEVEVDLERRRIKLHPGDVFGEMALISGQPRSANVTALDYCTLLKLTTSDFREIMRRYPEVRTPLAELAASRSAMNREPPAGDAVPPDPRDAPTA
ncbi:MAG TPA: cation:proton antiporter [Casimicrobiaceae bacterium]|nr:cation:proton antiporter [Casimicrobiaceae bacterium]